MPTYTGPSASCGTENLIFQGDSNGLVADEGMSGGTLFVRSKGLGAGRKTITIAGRISGVTNVTNARTLAAAGTSGDTGTGGQSIQTEQGSSISAEGMGDDPAYPRDGNLGLANSTVTYTAQTAS